MVTNDIITVLLLFGENYSIDHAVHTYGKLSTLLKCHVYHPMFGFEHPSEVMNT